MHTSFEKALIIAKENGYATEGNNQSEILNDKYKILLDKEFFIALGRGLGWEEDVNFTKYGAMSGWRYAWHRFIDHLVDGKDIESFFEQLIK